jgi:catechol 2,3-dioxygenase-like lactoylglutathione lyase family enzyme
MSGGHSSTTAGMHGEEANERVIGYSDRVNRESPQRAKLHHVALGARNLEPVAAFYRDRLGLPEVARHHERGGRLRSIWLDLGGPILMIEHTEEPPRLVQGVGAGPFLLALACQPPERDALERSLAISGFPVESRTEHTIYFRDPEGNRVAVSSYLAPEAS